MYPRKAGILCVMHTPPPEIFLCSTYKPHFFWDFFETLQVACYGRDLATLFISVAEESKLSSGESKTSKDWTIACVQAVRHSFFQIYFIFSAWIGGYEVLPSYLFCRPGFKIKSLNYARGSQKTTKILTWNLKIIALWVLFKYVIQLLLGQL